MPDHDARIDELTSLFNSSLDGARKLQTITDTIPSAIVIVDADGKFLYVNKHACDLYGIDYTGFTMDAHLEKVKALRLDGTPLPFDETPVSHSLKYGEVVRNVEMIIQNAEGIRFPVCVSSAPLLDNGGKVNGAVVIFEDCSARMQAQEALKEVLEFNHTMLGSSEVGIYVVNSSGKCTYVNEAGAAVASATIEQLMQLDYFTLDSWKRSGLLDASQRVLATGSPETVQRRFVNTFGKDAWYDCRFSRFFSGGEPHLLLECYDITERKKTEEQLQLHSSIAESLGEAIFAVDVNQNVLFWNKGAENLYGWRKEEAIGQNLTQLFTPVHYEGGVSREKAVQDYLEKGDWRGEASYLRKDGTVIDVMANGQMMKDQNGKITSMFIVHTDITEHKRAAEALRKSEEKYRELVENANSIIIRMDQKGIVSYFNNYAQDYFGYSGNEAIGKDIRILLPEKESVSGRDLKTMADNILENPDEYVVNINENIRKNGERVWVSWRNKAVKNDEGEIIGNLTIGQDITQLKKAEEALKKSEERQAFLLRLSDAIRPLSDAQTIKDIATKLLAERLGASHSSYNEYSEENCFIQSEKRNSDTLSLAGTHKLSDFSAGVAVLQSGKDLIVPDVSTFDDFPKEQRERYNALQVRAFVTIPLVKENRLVASLSARHMAPHSWTPEEVELIRETAERTWDAVERSHAEEALRKSEEKYRVLFDSIDEGFCIAEVLFDEHERPLDYRFLEVNQSFERQTGLARAAGRRMRDMAPNHEKQWFEIYGRVALTGQSARFQSPAKELGRFYDAYAFRVGRPEQRRIAILFNDITEHKRAEEAIKENETLMRSIMDSASDFMFIKDTQSRVVMVNRAYGRTFGVDIQQVIGKNDYELYSDPEMARTIIENDQYVMRTGETLACEESAVTPEGQRTYLMSKVPWKDAKGRTIGVLGTAHDITELKRTQDSLTQTIVSMKHQKEYIDILYETTGKILSSTTPQDDIDRLCTKVMKFLDCHTFFNYLLEEGETVMHLNASEGIPEELQPDMQSLPLGVAICGCAARDGCRIVAENIQAVEDPRTALIKLMGIRAYACHPLISDGRVIGTLAFGTRSRDCFSDEDLMLMNRVAESASMAISRKHNEEKLIRQAEELSAADHSKNQFISVLSHELRNPLAAISAGLSLIEMTDDKEQAATAKEIMRRQIGQLCKLVDDLLELTRITRNKIELKKETIELNKIIMDAVNDIRPRLQLKNIKIVMKLVRKPVFLYADSVRIIQCISNYLHNALKFTPENGVVQVLLEKERGSAVFSVRDNGIGIAGDVLKRLFEPFVQADQTLARNENGGLGLGLSIVKGIVELHGGTVSASSAGLGKGAVFTMTLPIAEGSGGAVDGLAVEGGEQAIRVLVIEDNRDLADMLCSILGILGHEATAACDGNEGVKVAHEKKPGIIFCDIGLPGISGYEVAKIIRNDPALSDVFLVALTGYAGKSDVEQAAKSGFDRHLAKPVNMAMMRQMLNEYNRERRR